MQTASATSRESERSGAARCLQCARFVGPYAHCPYCGARIPQPLSIRAIKLGAVLLATLGLLLLWWMARSMEVPTVAISAIVDTMNMAFVRVEGRVVRGPAYDPTSGYLSFWVDDTTGDVNVIAYREVSENLLELGRIPARGDQVSIAGPVRVRDDYVAITLNSPDLLTLVRPEATTLESAEITVLDEGRRVRLTGEIAEVRVPYAGMTLITLRDASGEIVIAVDAPLIALTGPLPPLELGQGIEVVGTVMLYRGQPQIVPAATSDLGITTHPPAPLQALEVARFADLIGVKLGQRVQVQGRVVMLEGLRGGIKATLDDGTDQIALVIWDSVYAGMESPRSLDIGAELEVQGILKAYQEELEVIPEYPTDVMILRAAPMLPWVTIEALTTRDVGRAVRVRGVLDAPSGFSSGVKLTLSDGTGSITVLLWTNIYQQLDPPPARGMQVEVSGLVSEYRGRLELIPRTALDWQAAP